MRINRGKAIRKYLRFYRIVYGIESPYQVILDGNFIYYALKYKVDIQDRLKVQLQVSGGESVRLFVTRSSLEELRSVPDGKGANAIAFANRFCEVLDDDNCADEKNSTAASRLTEFLWRNHRKWVLGPQSNRKVQNDSKNSPSHGFFVATQDQGLRRALAAIPGVPLVYLNNVAFVMEAPSDASKTFNVALESSKIAAVTDSENALLESVNKKRKRDSADSNVVGVDGRSDTLKSAIRESTAPEQKQERVKHRAKAANPLASKAPVKGSAKQKKLKASKFRKG